MITRLRQLSVLVLMVAAGAVNAQEPNSRPAAAILDNSFLVEEAYNQEPGVVQHILTFDFGIDRRPGADDRVWELAFTQEWPFLSQTHQLSYTIPYVFQDASRESENGIGDILLNYRLQLLTETETRPAVAPRFSLILPTGNENKGLGNGTVGYQFNLPVSKILTDRWTAHFNAGFTVLPDFEGEDLVDFNLGGSVIYAIRDDFNFLLEVVTDWTEDVSGARPSAVIISPGIRYARNYPGGEQLVLGIASPVGLTSAAPDYGVFLYASFEHAFGR